MKQTAFLRNKVKTWHTQQTPKTLCEKFSARELVRGPAWLFQSAFIWLAFSLTKPQRQVHISTETHTTHTHTHEHTVRSESFFPQAVFELFLLAFTQRIRQQHKTTRRKDSGSVRAEWRRPRKRWGREETTPAVSGRLQHAEGGGNLLKGTEVEEED